MERIVHGMKETIMLGKQEMKKKVEGQRFGEKLPTEMFFF